MRGGQAPLLDPKLPSRTQHRFFLFHQHIIDCRRKSIKLSAFLRSDMDRIGVSRYSTDSKARHRITGANTAKLLGVCATQGTVSKRAQTTDRSFHERVRRAQTAGATGLTLMAP